MYTTALLLRLRPGAYVAYKRAHDELWPELARSMEDHQVSMAIYRLDEQLVVFAAAPTPEHWARSRRDPVLDRWNHFMADYLETDATGSISFEELPKAFGFGEFR